MNPLEKWAFIKSADLTVLIHVHDSYKLSLLVSNNASGINFTFHLPRILPFYIINPLY